MRLTLISTSSLDYPSPRGRWLPLAHELVALGHEVRLVLLHHAIDHLPRSERRQVRGGVMVYYASQMHVYGPVGQRRYFGPAALLRVSLLGALRLAALASKWPSDAIHVCKPQPINGLAGVLAAQRLGCPLYVDCDDYEAGGNRFGAGWQKRLVRFWEDSLPQRAAGVTVNTRFLYDRNVQLGVPAERIVHVPNGISPQRLQPPTERQIAGLRAALGLGESPVVVYVGTMSQTTHNVGLLIDAFAFLREHMPDARLLLVGDGEDRLVLRDRIAALGLSDDIIMTGPVPPESIPIYLSLGGCSVDPVADDGVARGRSPLKIVESMAVGVPVVTGAVGDRSAMLGENGGIIVQPGSAAALAAGIEVILRDPALQRRLAAGARQRAEAYRWDVLAQRWLEVYQPAKVERPITGAI